MTSNRDERSSALMLLFLRKNRDLERRIGDMGDFYKFVEKCGSRINRNMSASNDKLKHHVVVPVVDDLRYMTDGSTASAAIDQRAVDRFAIVIRMFLQFLDNEQVNRAVKMKKDQENLPIYEYREEICKAIAENNLIIIAGDTGCGKSTQVPRYLLDAGFDRIICTQPRRLACISLAKRVASEASTRYRNEVAFQVRFDRNKSQATRMTFMTEGVVLRYVISDPLLASVDVILVDEVHERHVTTDFLLGILRCISIRRQELKVVLMSATMNLQLFQRYLGQCPVVKIPGRLFPIELHYRPQPVNTKSSKIDPSPYLSTMHHIDETYPNERGDLLIFVSGQQHISNLIDSLSEHAKDTRGWIILPLHGSMSLEEQDKVFHVAPDRVRKCIVSTNIAETSMTIDGVRFVIDSGKVKQMVYDAKLKTRRLREIQISKASAEQRKGRAGRTGPGVCFRFYSTEDMAQFDDYNVAEVHRVSLDNLVLQMYALGLTDVNRFPFIEQPSTDSINISLVTLKDIGALDDSGAITTLGRLLCSLPVELPVGKALILSTLINFCAKCLPVAAILSVASPFLSLMDRNSRAAINRRCLKTDDGDPIIILRTVCEWLELRIDGCDSRRWCKRYAIEEKRLFEIMKLRRQFEDLLIEHRLNDTTLHQADVVAMNNRRHVKMQVEKLKTQYHGNTRRRRLQLQDQDADNDNILPDSEINEIDRLEFDLTNNAFDLLRSITLKSRDRGMMRVIIASAFYPQVAIADPMNARVDCSEFCFHSKSKQFMQVHPSSLMQLDNSSFPPLNSFEDSHILIYFQTLLETNKSYIINGMPVPAMTTSLLTANDISTDARCQVVVVDGWLKFRFERTSNVGTHVVCTAVLIRQLLALSLDLRLSGSKTGPSSSTETENPKKDDQMKMMKIQKLVNELISKFLDMKVSYSLERLSYTPVSEIWKMSNEGNKDRTHRGGLKQTPYFEYDNLLEQIDQPCDDQQICEEIIIECMACQAQSSHTIMAVLHCVQCASHLKDPIDDMVSERKTPDQNEDKPAARMLCRVCSLDLSDMNAVDILRHRKSHL